MAKHDVTETSFKNSDGFLCDFDGRRQVDAGLGTESFVSISDAVFEILKHMWMGKAKCNL